MLQQGFPFHISFLIRMDGFLLLSYILSFSHAAEIFFFCFFVFVFCFLSKYIFKDAFAYIIRDPPCERRGRFLLLLDRRIFSNEVDNFKKGKNLVSCSPAKCRVLSPEIFRAAEDDIVSFVIFCVSLSTLSIWPLCPGKPETEHFDIFLSTTWSSVFPFPNFGDVNICPPSPLDIFSNIFSSSSFKYLSFN